MTIRPVCPKDLPAITAIYNHYVTTTAISFETEPVSLEAMTARIEEFARSYPCLVCETEGRIAGYCYAHAWKTRAAYAGTLETTIYLHRDFFGRGIGRALMERLIDECRRAGFDSLIACITYGNEASCRLHEKLGFKKVSHFKGVGRKFDRILDVVDMQLLLHE
ncbi:MAG: GNAT family N-acetyltransferase [Staphylococcus sp.]|nr:GNAT family N-acetyltransferase [Staphylococcus sp.]